MIIDKFGFLTVGMWKTFLVGIVKIWVFEDHFAAHKWRLCIFPKKLQGQLKRIVTNVVKNGCCGC